MADASLKCVDIVSNYVAVGSLFCECPHTRPLAGNITLPIVLLRYTRVALFIICNSTDSGVKLPSPQDYPRYPSDITVTGTTANHCHNPQ
jgi:hypothetical protein